MQNQEPLLTDLQSELALKNQILLKLNSQLEIILTRGKFLQTKNSYIKSILAEKDSQIEKLQKELTSRRNSHLSNPEGLLQGLLQKISEKEHQLKQLKDQVSHLRKVNALQPNERQKRQLRLRSNENMKLSRRNTQNQRLKFGGTAFYFR